MQCRIYFSVYINFIMLYLSDIQKSLLFIVNDFLTYFDVKVYVDDILFKICLNFILLFKTYIYACRKVLLFIRMSNTKSFWQLLLINGEN